MATVLSDMVDMFMTKVDDYRLNTIYQTSGSDVLSNYVEPWLLNSIVEFDICSPALVYTPTSGSIEGSFSEDLTLENKFILSELMVKYWLQKTVQDILQMNNFVQDHDYKMLSSSANLDAKRQYLNAKKEELSQILVDYGYRHNDWTGWKAQF